MSGPDNDISAFIYTLCEQRNLPVLVTDLIASYLDVQDLLPLSRLSRSLHQHAIPLIYRDIELDLSEPGKSGRKAVLLFRTLLTNKTAARNVRRLALTGDVLEEWRDENHYHESVHTRPIEEPFRGLAPPEILLDLVDFRVDEIEMYRNQTKSLLVGSSSFESQISLSWLCASIIGLCPHIEDLQIESDFFRYPEFRTNLKYLFESKHFTNLRSTSFCLDLPDNLGRHIQVNAVRDWDDVLLLPFGEPRLESISKVMTLATDKLSRMATSSLKRLVLHHVQVEPSDLNALLAATPALRYLEYHASIDYNWCWKTTEENPSEHHYICLEPLFRALHHVRDTLQELQTAVEFSEDGFGRFPANRTRHLPLDQQKEEMSRMKCLESLKIPYSLLLGWSPGSTNSYEWSEILPTSLRSITLTEDLVEEIDPNRWDDVTLMPILTSLAHWMTKNTHGTRPLEIKLILLEHDSRIDFGNAAKALKSICDEYCVQVSIEEDDTSFYKTPGKPGVHVNGFTCMYRIPSPPDPVEQDRQIEANRLRLARIR